MTFRSPKSGILVDDEPLYKESVAITVAEIQALITANLLAPSTLYRITNSAMGGFIYVRAISSNAIDNKAMWVRDTDLRAFGAIGLVSGTSGSVNSLSVDGVNQMTGVVNYTTSLANTCQLVCDNINANVNATWRAVRCDTQIVLESKTPGVAFNDKIVAATTTTLVLSTSYPTKYGYDVTPIQLDIRYNIANDVVTYCFEERKNTILTGAAFSDLAGTRTYFRTYRYGDPRTNYSYNILADRRCIDNYVYQDGGYFGFNSFVPGSWISNSFFYGTTASTGYYNNTITGIAFTLRHICITGNATGYINQLLGDATFCSIQNITIRGNSTNNGLQNIKILSGTGIRNINCNNNGLTISSAVLAANGCLIENINLTGTSNLSIFSVGLLSSTAKISNITGSQGTFQIYRSYIYGFNSGIDNLTLSGTGGTGGIYNATISGANSLISGITFNGNSNIITDVNISASNATFGGFAFDTTLTTVGNVDWSTGSYQMEYTTPTMNNTVNRGQINSPITLGYIPNKFYVTNAFIEANGLSSATNTAQLSIGIETDAPTAFLPATLITTLNGTITAPTVTRTKATAVRKIIATPTVEGITTGTFKITLQGTIGM